MEKLPSTKLVPGVRKFGDRWSTGCRCAVGWGVLVSTVAPGEGHGMAGGGKVRRYRPSTPHACGPIFKGWSGRDEAHPQLQLLSLFVSGTAPLCHRQIRGWGGGVLHSGRLREATGIFRHTQLWLLPVTQRHHANTQPALSHHSEEATC